MSVKTANGSKPMETLFKPGLANLKSSGFWLNGPITIMGSGLGEDDIVTFNVVYLKGAERPADDCDCLPVRFNAPAIISEEKLMCPECVDEVGFVPVRLTANNPVVILDSPLGQVIQAEYEGSGRENAHVWVYQGASLATATTELKGCPTECCEDLVWYDTGEFRCNIETDTKEIQQVSNCGRIRWIDEEPLTWEDTGETRCNIDQNIQEVQQVNNCGGLRWVEGPELTWTPTGILRCNDTEDSFEIQEVNNCGGIRWVDGGPLEWIPTGEFRCNTLTDTRDIQERNNCGETRWVDSEIGLTWLDTGNYWCDVENNTQKKEQRSECGDLRWVDDGPIVWTPTGEQRCNVEKDVLDSQEINICGDLRWVESEVALTWSDTGGFWCDLASDTQQKEQRNNCGDLRWVDDGPIVWTPTGETRCENQTVEVEEVNYCGNARWVDTEEKCDFTASFPIPGTCGWGYREGDNIDPEASVELHDCDGEGLGIWLYPTPRALPLATIPVYDCEGANCPSSGEVLGYARNNGPDDVERCDEVHTVKVVEVRPYVVQTYMARGYRHFVWSNGKVTSECKPEPCASLPVADGFAFRLGDARDPEATEEFKIDGITAWAYPTPRPGASIPFGNLYLANTSECYSPASGANGGGGSTSFTLDTLEQDAFGEDITYSNSTPTVTGD